MCRAWYDFSKRIEREHSRMHSVKKKIIEEEEFRRFSVFGNEASLAIARSLFWRSNEKHYSEVWELRVEWALGWKFSPRY